MTTAAAPRNHAAWIGPLVALIGLVSYFALAVKVPALRDSAALNLALVAAGVIIAAWGVLRRPGWRSWLGLGGAVASAVLLAGYVLVLSKQMPVADAAPLVGSPAPPLVLPDQSGRIVDLAGFADRRVVVLFYRGFW